MLSNSSKVTSTLSGALGKIKKPINILGKKRLYTHTLNGSKRYASTWGRFLGRWGTRILGHASVALLTYDVGKTWFPAAQSGINSYNTAYPISQSGNLIYHVK